MKRPLLSLAIVIAMQVCVLGSASGFDRDVDDGHHYYLRYCASCHGEDGDGRGPAAKALTTPPADLRLLGQKYGMPLPAYKIAQFIDGRDAIAAHGTREMPIWGERLYMLGKDKRGELGVGETIGKIIAYLNTLQPS